MKTLLLILISLSIQNVYSQDCEKFREGKFIEKNEDGIVNIERKRNCQIETSVLFSIDTRIRWIDECTYEQRIKKVLRQPSDWVIPESILKMKVTAKIIATGEDWYEIEWYSTFDKAIQKSIIYIDKK